MPTFQYQSMTTSGDRLSGVISAANRAEAVRTLLQRGETATSITMTMGAAEPAAEPVAANRSARIGFGRPTLRKTEMATLRRTTVAGLNELKLAIAELKAMYHGGAGTRSHIDE